MRGRIRTRGIFLISGAGPYRIANQGSLCKGLTGKLWKHLAGIDTACHERMDLPILATAKQEGVTEALKASACANLKINKGKPQGKR